MRMDKVALYARSDIGLVRTNNEDSYFTDVERGLAGHSAEPRVSATASSRRFALPTNGYAKQPRRTPR
jgi:hypothetical protein